MQLDLKSSGVAAFVLVLAERVALCQQFGRFWAGSVTNGAEGPTTPPSCDRGWGLRKRDGGGPENKTAAMS